MVFEEARWLEPARNRHLCPHPPWIGTCPLGPSRCWNRFQGQALVQPRRLGKELVETLPPQDEGLPPPGWERAGALPPRGGRARPPGLGQDSALLRRAREAQPAPQEPEKAQTRPRQELRAQRCPEPVVKARAHAQKRRGRAQMGLAGRLPE